MSDVGHDVPPAAPPVPLWSSLAALSLQELKVLLRKNMVSWPSRSTKKQLVDIAYSYLWTDHENGDDVAADDEADLQLLDAEMNAEISAIKLLHITKVTRKQYESLQKTMYAWWMQHRPSIAMRMVGTKCIGFQNLADVTMDDFEKMVYSSCKKTNGDGSFVKHPVTNKPMLIAFDSICNYRKAMFNLFTEAKERPSDVFSDRMKLFYKGLKRQDAKEKQEGARASLEGKHAMPFSVYAKLQEEFFKAGKFYELAYTSLTWHLMCRTDNTGHLTLKHLTTICDCLVVEFNVTKMDKEGDTLRNLRRCFSNPQLWQLDVIFCLGCYLTTVPELARNNCPLLFPGEQDSQKKRYQEALSAMLRTTDMVTFLAALGYKPSDFGAHSLRKGCATYVTSGSTGGPSIVAVCQRAGWSMGNVLDRYLKYDCNGDAFVGRVAAGLPLNSASFGDLPPHFVELPSPKTIEGFFPMVKAVPEFAGVAALCCANVIHHFKRIEALPECDGRTMLFKSAIVSEVLRDRHAWESKLVVGSEAECAMKGSMMTATGVPPQAFIIREVLNLMQAVTDLPRRMMLNFGQLMDERIGQVPHVTPSVLQEKLNEQRQAICKDVENLLRVRGVGGETGDTAAVESVSPEGYKLYWWKKGKEKEACGRLVPQDFEFPTGSVLDLWRMYWTSWNNKGVRMAPLKASHTFHLPRNVVGRWCELNSLANEMLTAIPAQHKTDLETGYRRNRVDLVLVNGCFDAAVGVVNQYRCAGIKATSMQMSTLLKRRALKVSACKRAAAQAQAQ